MMSILRNDPKLRKAYMAYQDDGVLDVFIGWCVFLAGLLMFTKLFWMAGAYVVLVTPMFLSFKESITVPRLGHDELSQVNERQPAAVRPLFAGGLALIVLLGLVMLYLLAGASAAAGLREVLLTISGGVIAVFVLASFAVMGYMVNAPRWYAYGALAIVLALLAWSTGLALPWVIMAAGSAIALTGSVYLFRFLRSHPLLPVGRRERAASH
jgi:hypothetical protein